MNKKSIKKETLVVFVHHFFFAFFPFSFVLIFQNEMKEEENKMRWKYYLGLGLWVRLVVALEMETINDIICVFSSLFNFTPMCWTGCVCLPACVRV